MCDDRAIIWSDAFIIAIKGIMKKMKWIHSMFHIPSSSELEMGVEKQGSLITINHVKAFETS